RAPGVAGGSVRIGRAPARRPLRGRGEVQRCRTHLSGIVALEPRDLRAVGAVRRRLEPPYRPPRRDREREVPGGSRELLRLHAWGGAIGLRDLSRHVALAELPEGLPRAGQ